jgi:hypothetical protein
MSGAAGTPTAPESGTDEPRYGQRSPDA